MSEWVNEWEKEWYSEWVKEWMSEWVSVWMSKLMSQWVICHYITCRYILLCNTFHLRFKIRIITVCLLQRRYKTTYFECKSKGQSINHSFSRADG